MNTKDTQPLDNTVEADKVMHVYKTSDGGIVLSPTEIDEDAFVSAPVSLQSGNKRLLIPFCIICLLAVSALVADGYLLFAPVPRATIMLSIRTHTIRDSAQYEIVSHQPQSAYQIAGTPLTSSVSKNAMVQATGQQHTNAQAARGTITFYNGSNTIVHIDATTFSASNGVQITMDKSIDIPASTPPIEGTVNVYAHAQQKGVQGNIAIKQLNYNVNGAVSAMNTVAFTGGVNESSYSYVKQNDIDAALQSLLSETSYKAMTKLADSTKQTYVQPTCKNVHTSDNASGDEVKTFYVHVTTTCESIAYNEVIIHDVVNKAIAHKATATLGTSYTEYGDVNISIEKGSSNVLHITSSGEWSYKLNVDKAIAAIAGTKPSYARAILLLNPDVKQVTLTLVNSSMLPVDKRNISLYVTRSSND